MTELDSEVRGLLDRWAASPDRSFPTRQEARTAVFDYIETFYNPIRLHSTLGYLSPAEYEKMNKKEKAA